jgi:hypothetical protein
MHKTTRLAERFTVMAEVAYRRKSVQNRLQAGEQKMAPMQNRVQIAVQ